MPSPASLIRPEHPMFPPDRAVGDQGHGLAALADRAASRVLGSVLRSRGRPLVFSSRTRRFLFGGAPRRAQDPLGCPSGPIWAHLGWVRRHSSPPCLAMEWSAGLAPRRARTGPGLAADGGLPMPHAHSNAPLRPKVQSLLAHWALRTSGSPMRRRRLSLTMASRRFAHSFLLGSGCSRGLLGFVRVAPHQPVGLPCGLSDPGVLGVLSLLPCLGPRAPRSTSARSPRRARLSPLSPGAQYAEHGLHRRQCDRLALGLAGYQCAKDLGGVLHEVWYLLWKTPGIAGLTFLEAAVNRWPPIADGAVITRDSRVPLDLTPPRPFLDLAPLRPSCEAIQP
jgi:hypothetical protein